MPYYRQSKSSNVKFTGPSKAAILKDTVPGWIKVLTPYKADFVDELKSTVQPSHRVWEPVEKVWRVLATIILELSPVKRPMLGEPK